MGQFNLKLDIQKFASNGVHIVQAYETDVDIANNLSYVYLEVQVSTNSTTYNNTGNAYVNITASSPNNSYGTGNVKFNISKNTTKTVWSGKLGPFYHNSDGSLGNVSVSVTSYITSSTKPSTSTSIGMSTIPRYANITTLYTSNIGGYDGLHGLYVTWNADASCDHLQYSLNGGGWTDANGYPTFAIWGLAPNTSHNIRIRVKRQDSQLWTESGYIYGTTKDINRISSGVPNISNGNALRVTASNPSGAGCKIIMEVPAGSRRITKTGTDVTFSAEEVNSMMQYIGQPTSSIRVTADTIDNSGNIAYSSWNDGTYTLVNSNPTFNAFLFEDINEKTLALTGNNQNCIKGYSTIKATIPVDLKAVSKNYATMSKYRLTIGGNTTDVAYSDTEDVSMQLVNASSGIYTVHAIDSRGLSTPVELLANNVIDYTGIEKDSSITATRVNADGEVVGTSELVKLSFGGSIWYSEDGSKGNFGVVTNSIKSAKYRFKPTNQSEWTEENTYQDIEVVLNTDGTYSFNDFIKGDTEEAGFNISNAYNIEVVVEDELSSATYTANIGSGTPHVAYARNGVSFMGKYDEDEGGKLQIDGKRFDGKVLYSGWSNGTITLSDSAENYKRFIIYYSSNDTWYNSVECYNPNSKSLTLENNHYLQTTAYLKHRTISISGNQITTSGNNYFQVALDKTNNVWGVTNENHSYITGVVGYKY